MSKIDFRKHFWITEILRFYIYYRFSYLKNREPRFSVPLLIKRFQHSNWKHTLYGIARRITIQNTSRIWLEERKHTITDYIGFGFGMQRMVRKKWVTKRVLTDKIHLWERWSQKWSDWKRSYWFNTIQYTSWNWHEERNREKILILHNKPIFS